ncbi:MAG: toll/interleukin-1 receptor domain-containing protein [Thermoplasmatota archaeon]
MEEHERPSAPIAFVCHASEDKARFVTPFASGVRKGGVDAWVDQWEMFAGDSLVRRIFDEALPAAKAFIIVLSRNSIDKPWVREELDAAVVRRIEGKLRIIPVVIDDAPVPLVLQATLRVSARGPNDLEKAVDEVLAAIFRVREKPAIGPAPKVASQSPLTVPGLQAVDAIVLDAACVAAVENGHKQGVSGEVVRRLSRQHADLTNEQIEESLEMLDEHGLIEATRSMGQGIFFMTVCTAGFDIYARERVPDYARTYAAICAELASEGRGSLDGLTQSLDAPRIIIEHVLDHLKGQGLVEMDKYISGGADVYSVSPRLKRAVAAAPS